MIYYRCDRCDFQVATDFVPREYVLGEGRVFPMQQRHIWCDRCNTVTVAESLVEAPGERELRKRFREGHRAELTANNFRHEFERELRHKWLRDAEEYERSFAEWRSRRRSPPHCLRCGNDSIIVPIDRFSDLAHPPCGGTLRCTFDIEAGTFVGPEPHKYSVDGELIELGYWQGPYHGDKRRPLELWSNGQEGMPLA